MQQFVGGTIRKLFKSHDSFALAATLDLADAQVRMTEQCDRSPRYLWLFIPTLSSLPLGLFHVKEKQTLEFFKPLLFMFSVANLAPSVIQGLHAPTLVTSSPRVLQCSHSTKVHESHKPQTHERPLNARSD